MKKNRRYFLQKQYLERQKIYETLNHRHTIISCHKGTVTKDTDDLLKEIYLENGGEHKINRRKPEGGSNPVIFLNEFQTEFSLLKVEVGWIIKVYCGFYNFSQNVFGRAY